MTSSTEDPILIPSDDEGSGSDNDDVVLVKEEIEVDSDDVIFLSETKAPTPPVTESSSTGGGDSDTMDTGETRALNLSTGSLVSHTPTDDLCNFILGPLDLSAKADSHNQSCSNDKSANNNMQDDLDLFNSLLFDTDVYNNAHLNSASGTGNSLDANVSDNKTQGPKSSPAAQYDKVSGSNGEAKTNSSNISDQNTKQTPDTSSTSSQLPDIISKTFNIDSLLGVPSYSSAATHSTESNTVTSTTSQRSDAVLTSSNSKPLLPENAKSNSSNNITVISPGNADTSQSLLMSSDPMWSSKDDIVNKIKQSLPCYHCLDTNMQTSPVQSTTTSMDQSSSNFISQTASVFCQSVSPLRKTLSALVPRDQTGDKDDTQKSGNLQQTSVSQPRNSLYPQTGLQTSTQTIPQNQSSAGSQSSSVTGSSLDQGLPGGSKFYTSQSIGLSNQKSAFRVLNTISDNQTAVNPQYKRSNSYTDQSYMYNPLTLPKSQKESYMRSFSSSSLNSWSSTDYNKRKSDNLLTIGSATSTNSMDTSASATEGPYQLPPKKQKRCFVELKCTSCQVDISGDKCCKCPIGHATCARCLEEKVKKILTGKAKESIRCLTAACDSFYAISELKLCLPSMVVEILEDRLDQDYVNYFSSINLKTVLDELNGEESSGIDFGEDEGLGPSGQGIVPKKPADVDPELPENWEPMNEKSGYTMFTLDVNSEEYNQIMPQFFSSMINHKVEVVRIHRIQNPILWKFYSVKKKEMVLDNEGFGPVNEQLLYHGTDASVVDAICRKGFDWRVCGKNGTLYGQGTYFAVHASYSHQYTDIKASRHSRQSSLIMQHHTGSSLMGSSFFSSSMPPQAHTFRQNPGPSVINLSSSGQVTSSSPQVMVLPLQSPSAIPTYKIVPKPVTIRSMSGLPTWPPEEFIEPKKHTTQVFVARVLVGKYSGGSCKLRKPPPLDPKSDPLGKCYDSCVDDIHMPKIFVIFDSVQAYPEYLIEYTYE